MISPSADTLSRRLDRVHEIVAVRETLDEAIASGKFELARRLLGHLEELHTIVKGRK